MSNRRDQLLTDAHITMPVGRIHPLTAIEVRDYYEAALTNNSKLIQTLVDTLNHFRPTYQPKIGDVERYWANGGKSPTQALLDAESAGFKPTSL